MQNLYHYVKDVNVLVRKIDFTYVISSFPLILTTSCAQSIANTKFTCMMKRAFRLFGPGFKTEPLPESLQKRGFTFVQGVDILEFDQTPLIYSVSYFNCGA